MRAPLQILPSLISICDPFDAILLDAYGVFWGGNEYGLLPGCELVMQQLVMQGKHVGILSNSTQLASKETEKLQRHGLFQGKHFHFLITSGQIAKETFSTQHLPFKTPQKTFWLFGDIHPKFSSHDTIFQDTGYRQTANIDEADFIYVSVPHVNGEDQIDPEVFRHHIANIKAHNLPMVCPNPDRFAHEGSPPRAVVRQGSIAKIYEEMGGEVFYIGKPYPHAYTVALKRYQQERPILPKHILMVGDTPETDIRGANAFGMSSALVTKTGIMAERISHKGIEAALKSLAQEDTPHYLLERL